MMSDQAAVNLWGMITFLENDDLSQLISDLDYGNSVAQPELSATTMEQSEQAPWLLLEGDWNPPFYPLQEEQNLLSVSSFYGNNSAITSADIISTDNFSSVSPLSPTATDHSQFSSFSPFSSTFSYNSQLKAESPVSSSVSVPPTLVMPRTSTNTHINLQKITEEKARKKEHEDAVMFVLECDGNGVYDGYSWRKYGEKSIKNRDFPRSYYRCRHGVCKVKKHIERSSEIPAEVFITYYGHHNHYAITGFSSNEGGWTKSSFE